MSSPSESRSKGASRSGPPRSKGGPPARGKGGPPKRSGPGGPKRSTGPRRDDDRSADLRRKGWGSLARKGAARIAPRDDISDTASIAWRKAVQEARDQDLGTDFEPEQWVEVEEVRAEATDAVRRGKKAPPTGRNRSARDPGAPASLADQRADLAKSVGPQQAEKLDKVLKEAAKAFERERFGDTRRLLAPVAERVPSSAPVRELLGLSYYRMGRWKQAIRELEAFRDLSNSTEQHPVLADCYRALSRWKQVDELWDELRQASPSAELVTEGRIVTAGALADRGELREAIALLGAQRWTLPKGPKDHHLRRAYALADLYERAGDVPHARELFGRIQRVDAGFADVGDRIRALS